MNTRQEILEHLSKNTYANAVDLAQILAKTRANIQYHLHHLEQAGMIIAVFPRSTASDRGRPRRYFSLSQAERPNNLALLAEVLLDFVKLSAGSPQTQADLFTQIAQKIIKRSHAPVSGTVRLNRLVRELSNHGYQARWEAHAAGPEIVFRNCPYAVLLPGHPELCQMDSLLLSDQLGQPMTQTARIQLPGISACRFSQRVNTG